MVVRCTRRNLDLELARLSWRLVVRDRDGRGTPLGGRSRQLGARRRGRARRVHRGRYHPLDLPRLAAWPDRGRLSGFGARAAVPDRDDVCGAIAAPWFANRIHRTDCRWRAQRRSASRGPHHRPSACRRDHLQRNRRGEPRAVCRRRVDADAVRGVHDRRGLACWRPDFLVARHHARAGVRAVRRADEDSLPPSRHALPHRHRHDHAFGGTADLWRV